MDVITDVEAVVESLHRVQLHPRIDDIVQAAAAHQQASVTPATAYAVYSRPNPLQQAVTGSDHEHQQHSLVRQHQAKTRHLMRMQHLLCQT